MSKFTRLIRFESGGKVLFADLTSQEIPSRGSSITGYKSFEDLINNVDPVEGVVEKVWAFTKYEVQALQKTDFMKSFFLPYLGQTNLYIASDLIIGRMQKRPVCVYTTVLCKAFNANFHCDIS